MSGDATRSLEGFKKGRERRKLWQKKRREEGGAELRAKEAEAMKARRAANPEKYRVISNRSKAKARRTKPYIALNQKLLWDYGITLEQYNSKLVTQLGKCAICGGNNGGNKLVVDHDHSKPKGEGNRGLLCTPCNLMLGAAFDNTETLRRAASYLEAHNGA